jgi:hypothetical protein
MLRQSRRTNYVGVGIRGKHLRHMLSHDGTKVEAVCFSQGGLARGVEERAWVTEHDKTSFS